MRRISPPQSKVWRLAEGAGTGCGDLGDAVEGAVDAAYDAVVDPRNATLTYTGAHVLWAGGTAWESPLSAWDRYLHW